MLDASNWLITNIQHLTSSLCIFMNEITSTRLGEIYVRREADIIKVRARVRRLAREMGFDSTTQIKITTAISELTRNIYEYAKSGAISLSLATRGAAGARP